MWLLTSEHTAACFTSLANFFNSLVLKVRQGDDCCLTLEKQTDVLGSEGQSRGFVFLALLSCVSILFFGSAVGSDRCLLSVTQKAPKPLERINARMPPAGRCFGEDKSIL